MMSRLPAVLATTSTAGRSINPDVGGRIRVIVLPASGSFAGSLPANNTLRSRSLAKNATQSLELCARLAELKERVQTHLTEQRAREQFAAPDSADGDPTGAGDELPVHELEVEIELLRRCSERSGEVAS